MLIYKKKIMKVHDYQQYFSPLRVLIQNGVSKNASLHPYSYSLFVPIPKSEIITFVPF
jgi:hypothetical protein